MSAECRDPSRAPDPAAPGRGHSKPGDRHEVAVGERHGEESCVEQLLQKQAASSRTEAAPRYSNLRTALLGHALAVATHTDYVILVQQRLLLPLSTRGGT